MNFKWLQPNAYANMAGNQQAWNSHLGRPRALQRSVQLWCNRCKVSINTWSFFSWCHWLCLCTLAESMLTGRFQFTKRRGHYQIRALMEWGTKKITQAGAPSQHKQIGTRKIAWCPLNGRLTRYFCQATRILWSDPLETCIEDNYWVMNLW